MRTLIILSLLTGCTGSPVFGDISDSFTSAFDSFSTHLPVDATQIPACIPEDQLIDGIGTRLCDDFGFNLADSTTDDKRLKQASSAGDENQFTSYEAPVSKFTSPYLIADSSGNGGISLPQLGAAGLAAAYGIFIACFQSLGNLLSPSGTTYSNWARNAAKGPKSGTRVEGKIQAPPTESDSSENQACPIEIYAHRQLALCDIGIQSVQYSELDDMFILRDPTIFVGGCTSLSFVPHWCCDPDTVVPECCHSAFVAPDIHMFANCWPFPINYDISDLPQSSLSTFGWWEFFNSQ